jgi:antitoxin component of MazEF toxin-antitoxin module
MEHGVKIEKIGGGLGLQIPDSTIKHLGLKNGDLLNCEIKDKQLFLTLKRPHGFKDMDFPNEFDKKEWTW